MHRQSSIIVGAALLLAGLSPSPLFAAGQPQADGEYVWPVLAACLAWLVPAGLILITAAGMPTERARQAALAGVTGMGLAALVYFLFGFGLAFGGVGLLHGQEPGFAGLVWEWSILGPDWGPTWGMAGLAGWALNGAAATPAAYALFVTTLPWVAAATLTPLMALRGRTPAPVSLLAGVLTGGLLLPLALNWVWGGGWLANLGANLGAGHGFVDFAGGTAFLVGGAVALAGLLALIPRRPPHSEPPSLPPVHLPLLASTGALLVLAGSVGWQLSNPLVPTQSLAAWRGAVNALLAAAGGALLPLGYTWFVAGRGDPLMAAKGLAAGAIAGMVVGPFVPPWAALALGSAVGLLVPFVTYLVNETLRIADDSHVVSVYLLGSVLGVLAVGLAADGLAGAGWHGVGADTYLGVAGQGVTGLLPAETMLRDWPGQMQAQAAGLVALFLAPFLIATLVFAPVAVLMRSAARPEQRLRDAEPMADPPAVNPAEPEAGGLADEADQAPETTVPAQA